MFKFGTFNDETVPCVETEIDEELSVYTNAFISALRGTIENKELSTEYIKGYLNGMKFSLSETDSVVLRGYIEGTEEGLRYRENVTLPLKENNDFDEILNIFRIEETNEPDESENVVSDETEEIEINPPSED